MNLKDRILQIREIGISSGIFKVYLKQGGLKESSFYLNEDELYTLDKLYKGAILKKVVCQEN